MLLKQHRRLGPHHTYPSRLCGKFHRSFQLTWLDEYPWMVYSEQLDGVNCISCVLFCKSRKTKGKFVNTPFTVWHKRAEKCRDHENSKYHQEALILADKFVMSIEKPASNVSTIVDVRKAANVEHNRSVVKSVAEALFFVAGSVLPFVVIKKTLRKKATQVILKPSEGGEAVEEPLQ